MYTHLARHGYAWAGVKYIICIYVHVYMEMCVYMNVHLNNKHILWSTETVSAAG